MEVSKFVVCVPRGGLNDNLCQIGKCYAYAKKYDRTLLVDARRSSFYGEFSDYFDPANSDSLMFFNSSFINELPSGLTYFPSCIKDTLLSYQPVHSDKFGGYLESKSRVPLTFDFNNNYSQNVLLHEQYGGGVESFNFIKEIVFEKKLADLIKSRLQKCFGRNYYGVHVRNTDKLSDYKGFFQLHQELFFGKRILICSDDFAVVSYAKSHLSNSELFFLSDIPDNGRKPLHAGWLAVDDAERKANAVNSLVDLLGLAYSEKLFYANVINGLPSGFTRLADFLNRNQSICDSLLKR